jgi:hypothetical protein
MTKPSPYRIVEKIGEGGMGVVYRAEDTQLNRDVAIKVLRIDSARQLSTEKVQEIQARFHKEAQAAARLNHPNIVSIYQVGMSGTQPYIVMELLKGKSLLDRMEEGATFEEIVRLIIQVCDALDYAHRMGVVHRDVKPDNIVVSEDGRLKITDFGIARVEDLEFMQTRTGVLLGSPAYCAPEQLRDFSNVDGRADLFSLGVILYQWLTGRLPFEGESATEVISRILTREPVPPRAINPKIPAELESVALKALAKEPEERIASAAEFRKALESASQHAKGDGGGALDRTMTIETMPRGTASPLPILVAVLLFIGLVGYGVISLRGELGILEQTATLRGTHMARMLEVVGVDASSAEKSRILQGYLRAMGKEQDIVFLEINREDRLIAKYSDQERMIQEGDIYVRGFPLRMEGSGDGMLLVGFSKNQYNARVGHARTILIVGSLLLVIFVGALLVVRKKGFRWGKRAD